MAAASLVVWLHLAGRDWDHGHLLHPDERFLAMTVSAQRWPSGVAEYFDEARSPVNPRNAGAGYFAYGTLPTTLLTGLATLAGPGDAIATARLGRALNAGVSLLTVLLTALLASADRARPTRCRRGSPAAGMRRPAAPARALLRRRPVADVLRDALAGRTDRTAARRHVDRRWRSLRPGARLQGLGGDVQSCRSPSPLSRSARTASRTPRDSARCVPSAVSSWPGRRPSSRFASPTPTPSAACGWRLAGFTT